MVEPLMDDIMETEEQRHECYAVIYQETLRLEKLVGDMLDLSRLQDGRIRMEMEMLDVTGICAAAKRRMDSIARTRGVEIALDIDKNPMMCMGNEDRILQVFTILLDNALGFTPKGGNVTIFARDMQETVLLGVRDTGTGIEPKDLPFIWERFYKADKSRMRTTGTGLGLAIARLVVELMGGTIQAESVPGNGATFTFILKKTGTERAEE